MSQANPQELNIVNNQSLNKWFNEKAQEIKENKGLSVNWVQTSKDLAKAGKDGLFETYKNIFAEAPYFEKFSVKEVKDYFSSMLKAGGFIFTAYKELEDKTKELTAFVASIPLSKKEGVIEVVKPYLDIDASSYFAEDAVIAKNRRQGISREMKKILIEANKRAGYKTMLLRTSRDSFNQAAATKQLGGKQIAGLTQKVDSLRLNGETKPDTRVFFTFDLKK